MDWLICFFTVYGALEGKYEMLCVPTHVGLMQAHLVSNASYKKQIADSTCVLFFFKPSFLVPAINNSSHYDADFCSLLNL